MSQPRQPNPGTEEKNDPLEELEGQVEGPKMETLLLQDFQVPPPGGTGSAPLREEATPPITTESLPKGAERVVDEGESSLGVAEVTVAPTQPPLGRAVAVGAEWGAGVVETSAHLSPVATIMSLREKEPVEDMVRIGPSITRPEPGTEVKPAARVQNMRKSPREGGRGVQRLAVRVVQVTSVTPTKMRTRNPTTRTALIMPASLAVETCHPHHPEVPRPGSSPHGVCLPGEEGVEVVEEETSIGVEAMLEGHLEVTESDPTQPLMVDPPSQQPQVGSSKARHKALGPRTWEGEEMEERRKTRCLMQVKLKVKGPMPLSPLCPLQLLPLWVPLKMEVLLPSKAQPILHQTLEGPMHSLCPLAVGFPRVGLSDHPDVAATGDPSISKTNRPASGG